MYGRSWMRRVLTKHQRELLRPLRPAPVEGDADAVDQRQQRTPTLHLSFGETEGADGAVKPPPKRSEDDDSWRRDNFHCAAGPILVLGQCFAVMPVLGVRAPSPRRMRFSRISLPVLVTLFFLATSSVLTMSQLKHLARIGVSPRNFVGIVFFGCSQTACVLFFSLATRWPRLIRFWTRTEKRFMRPPYAMPQRRLATRIRRAAMMIVVLSALEHGLYLCNAITIYRRRTLDCMHVHNTTGALSFDQYMQQNYDYVFRLLPYYTAVGVSILIINGACTFIWNYMDLFIMMISKGIAYRFEQITARINTLADKEVPQSVFIELREDYVKLCELLDFVDDNLSGIVLLSSLNNLYFICFQLLNIFNKLRWPVNYIYFWYSLLYLIGRTAYVFLAAASINDKAKGALGVLRRVPSRSWCIELERLIFQMTTQVVALSGKKFYFLTRRLLFGMAGTIVTYELVLLQFDEPNRSKGLPDLCA